MIDAPTFMGKKNSKARGTNLGSSNKEQHSSQSQIRGKCNLRKEATDFTGLIRCGGVDIRFSETQEVLSRGNCDRNTVTGGSVFQG